MHLQADDKLAVAVISNAQTPYRLHLHRRIVEEVPEIRLFSVFTHEASNSPWQIDSPAEIRPLCFGRGEKSEQQSLWFRQGSEWVKAKKIIEFIAERRVCAVVIFGYNDLGRLRVIHRCRTNGIPCMLFGDSNILGERLSGWKLALKRIVVSAVVRRCSAILYCGRLGAAYFQQYGATARAMFPFPYEPNYTCFDAVPSDAVEEVRRRFALSPGRHYLIYSGRLVNAKRVDLLVGAFEELAPLRLDWDLIIAGDGPLRSVLSAAVPESIRRRIVWAGFLNNTATLAALYKCSDVLVLPSDFEPWGVVVNEAATGLALVCSSAVGAAAELLENGVNGRVFAAGNGQALLTALLEVTDPSNLDRMKAASPRILASWRDRADPVAGLRAALRFVGVLPAQ